MVGDTDVIATLEGSYTLSYDFMDQWRADGEKFNRIWEDRWVRDEGYTKFIPQAITGLLKKYKLNIKDFAKVVIPCIYLREHQGITKGLQLEDKQIQKEMLTTVGDTGTAHALMMLVAALEDAKPGDKILVSSYGNGADAMFFQVTEHIEKARNRRGDQEAPGLQERPDQLRKIFLLPRHNTYGGRLPRRGRPDQAYP